MSNKLITTFLIIGTCLFLFIGNKIYNDKVNRTVSAEALEFQKEQSHSKSPVEKNYFKENRGNLVYSAIGDSLTAGYFASDDSKKFVSVLSKLLEDKMGYKVTSFSYGNYGGVLSSELSEIPKINSQNPDIITIEFGTNDLNSTNNVPVQTFTNELNQLIDGLTTNVTKHPKIVLVTTWNQGDKSVIYDNAIKQVGKERNIPVADVSSLWQDSTSYKGPAGISTYKGQSDNFHPNDNGHQAIANIIFDAAKDELN